MLVSWEQLQTATCSTQFLADMFGLSTRRVRELAETGVLHRAGRDTFPFLESYRTLNARLEDQMPDPEASRLKHDRLKAETDLKTAKATLEAAKARELERSMFPAEDVEAMTNDLISTIRAALLALPERMAGPLAQAETPAQVAASTQKIVYEVLEELSTYHFEPEEKKK